MSSLCTYFPNYVPHSPFADQLMTGPLYYAQRISNGRKFRLLRILPAIDPHQQLECTCHLYNINVAPLYEVLSYVWGSPTPSVEILCNGQTVEIGSELSYALRRCAYDTPNASSGRMRFVSTSRMTQRRAIKYP